MDRDHDKRAERSLAEGQGAVAALGDDELEAELTIAIAAPTRRARRLDALLLERARRRGTERASRT